MMVMKNQTFQVSNGRTSCHLIPYIGNKSGFSHIFDSLIPDSIRGKQIYDVFGGGASFSIYCSYRFGSKYVTYNDNNPTVANFISWVKEDPSRAGRTIRDPQGQIRQPILSGRA